MPNYLPQFDIFILNYPAVSFTMQEATTQEQIENLERGHAAIGFMRRPGRTALGLKFEPILKESVIVALPCAHRLAKYQKIPLVQLQQDAFVSSPRYLGQGFHDHLMQLCEIAGFVPRVVQQARQLQTLVALVAAGFGVALLPASLAQHEREDVVFRPIQVDAPDALRYLELLMVWNEYKHCAIRDKLLDEVRNVMGSQSIIEII